MSAGGVYLARFELGFIVRVSGRGTLRESPTFRETVHRCLLARPARQVVVDLTHCHYLDSTFMGSMIWLHKRAGEAVPDRLRFVADSSKAHQLLSHSLLDRVLNLMAECPPALGEFVEIPLEDLSTEELGRHVEECHRKLAHLGGPHSETFLEIAERLRREREG